MVLKRFTKEIQEHKTPRQYACYLADKLTKGTNGVYRVRYDNENGYQIIFKRVKQNVLRSL